MIKAENNTDFIPAFIAAIVESMSIKGLLTVAEKEAIKLKYLSLK